MHRIDTPGNNAGLFIAPNPGTGQQAVLIDSPWLNDVQENVAQAIEGAGIALVKGNYGQLLAAIRALVSAAVPYCTDTGAANAYVITPTPALGAYAAGVSYRVKFIHANTGASVIATSGLPNRAVTRPGGAPLEPGDIPANSEGIIIDDGTRYQLTDQVGLMVGDSGGGGFAGLVAGPAAGDAAAGKVWTAAGIWAAIATLIGDSGGGGTKGLAPAPAAGDAALQRVLTAAGVWGRDRFVSAAQAFTNNTEVSVAHGLAGPIWRAGAFIVCTTAENGYSIGDRVQIPFDLYDGHAGGNESLMTVGSDANNVWFSVDAPGGIYITTKTGSTRAALTDSRWALYLYAEE